VAAITLPVIVSGDATRDRVKSQKTLIFIGWNAYCCFLIKAEEAVYMKLSIRKTVLGAVLALSFGVFTIPAGASVPPLRPITYVGNAKKVVRIQIAQVAGAQKKIPAGSIH
jgi:hypothetical protein